jgi:hypothetical protein
MDYKICTKCGRELPIGEFYKHSTTSDGYSTQCKECCKERQHNPTYRAKHLLCNYNTRDRNNGLGKGDLTAQWIIDNIFSQPCTHCGKEGWEIIGCNRLDNTKPHTKDNVEPCCKECNVNLANKEKGSYSSQFKKKHTKYSWWK